MAASAVSGQVLDEQGRPVAGARVYFVSAPVSMPDVAQLTNETGRFSVTAPAPGTYRIGIAASGHAAYERDVNVAGGKKVSLTVRLK